MSGRAHTLYGNRKGGCGMDTEQTVEQKRAIWQRVNPTLQPYPAEADAVNVCCMGVNAREDVEVIQGFIEEELADRRSYLACAGMAQNAAARQVMRRLAAECPWLTPRPQKV